MHTAQACISTDRAERYLTQLCDHLGQLSGHGFRLHRPRTGHGGPPDVRHVEHSSNHGEITFGWGRCTLDAAPDTLTVDLVADDAEALSHGQTMIGDRLQTIGRRDGIEVAWQVDRKHR